MMNNPLTNPHPIPMNKATIKRKANELSFLMPKATKTETKAMILPTERSMPPVMITNVMPIEIIVSTEICRRIFSRLSFSMEPGASIEAKINMTKRGMTILYSSTILEKNFFIHVIRTPYILPTAASFSS
jgi:hypothetical protein